MFSDEQEEKKRKRAEGVLFKDYASLAGRIEKMEKSVSSIFSKVIYNIYVFSPFHVNNGIICANFFFPNHFLA